MMGTSQVIFGYNGRDGVVTEDNGLIYMRARYYSPEMKRFINADIIAGSISNAVTLNRFAYANGNPVSNIDPFGLMVADFLDDDGDEGLEDNDSGMAGGGGGGTYHYVVDTSVAARSSVWTGGLHNCGYSSYSYSTPPRAPKSSQKQLSQEELNEIEDILKQAANVANDLVSGKGPWVGTKKHSEFKKALDSYDNPYIKTEVSFKNQRSAYYGENGSIRFDAAIITPSSIKPIAAYDFKTGNATLTPSRIEKMRAKSGFHDLPIKIIK